jgi:hypothetical protein
MRQVLWSTDVIRLLLACLTEMRFIGCYFMLLLLRMLRLLRPLHLLRFHFCGAPLSMPTVRCVGSFLAHIKF